MSIQRKILKEINKHQTIIIHRHSNPDGDAIGSQYGLYLALKENCRNKKIYAVGDCNDRIFMAGLDKIGDDIYNDALVIITDVAVKEMISDDRYKLAKTIIIIDHHKNIPDLDKYDLFYHDPLASSACAMVTSLLRDMKMTIPSMAATYLYGGMVTDSGRFLYLDDENAESTLEIASFLMKSKPNIKAYYDYLYLEPLEKKRAKNLFMDFKLTKNNVAYRKNSYELVQKSGLDFFGVSRGMVNNMAGIKEVSIWVSFTENKDKKIGVEIRSRGVSIVDIAKEFGGGGHDMACGATIDSFEEADVLLARLDERSKENGKNK